MKPEVRMSVRAVVEMTLHDSDLISEAGMLERMQEGAQAHRQRQNEGELSLQEYAREVALSSVYETEDLCLIVQGRADGIYKEGELFIIEEIKLGDLSEPLEAHTAQCRFYGHMLCQERALDSVELQVIYVDAEGKVQKRFRERMDRAALQAEFEKLCRPAAAWQGAQIERIEKRNRELSVLRFPFPSYRPGQREFSTRVFAAIRDRKRLFAQAPTGIGKTMAALYPALHALRQGHCAKVLFLTSRTTGHRACMEAVKKLQVQALTVCEIMAKDKICPLPERTCSPEVCPYASGYYDRLATALQEAGERKNLSSDALMEVAEKYKVCPYAFSLDCAQWADLVVLDSNYVYDPAVRNETLACPPGGACYLVDEAHRLAERVRDNYSASLSAAELRARRREIGKSLGRSSVLYKSVGKLASFLEQAEEGLSEPMPGLREQVDETLSAAERTLSEGNKEAVLDLYDGLFRFDAALKRFDERYAWLQDGNGKHFTAEIRLLDAAPYIQEASRRARGAVYFSATLTPLGAMQKVLGAKEGDLTLELPSPFDPSQLQVRIEPIDLRYQVRQDNLPRLQSILAEFFEAHPGNTMVFFPSYALLEQTLEGLRIPQDRRVFTETRGMAEADRQAVVNAFAGGKGNELLLCVMGGAFSEGIDLPGEQLENAVIVTLGLPVPDRRTLAMVRYYREQGEDGQFLAVTLPGMVRVIQACGRLIRTDRDRGNLLLIDRRFASRQIRTCLSGTLMDAALRQAEKEELH